MQGLTTTGSRATQSPQKVLKVAEDRPSTPPCRPVFVAPRATCPACPLRRGRRSEIRPRRNLTAAAPPFPQRGSTHSHKHTSGNSVCIAGPLRTIVDRRLSVRLPGAAPPPPGLSGLTPPWRNNLASARTGGGLDQLRRCRHSSTALDPRGTVKVAGESCRSRGRQEGLRRRSGHDVAGGGSCVIR